MTSTSISRKLAPAASFADVLKDLSKDDDQLEDRTKIWARSDLRSLEGQCITFQQIEVEESSPESPRSEIHLFGLTKAGNSILVRVLGFEHYFYFPCPPGFSRQDLNPFLAYFNDLADMGKQCVSNVELESQCFQNGRSATFLKISLSHHSYVGRARDELLTSGNCLYRNLFSQPELSCEANIPFFLRFMIDCEIKAMQWLQIPAGKHNSYPRNQTISRCQLEVSVMAEDLLICDTIDNLEKFAPFRILSFDIECDVPREGNRVSNPKTEQVLQIGSMVATYGEKEPFIRIIFTLGSCAPIEGAQVLSFKGESELLTAWQKFFIEVDPDIVTGYNITKFDIPYLLNRTNALGLSEFPFLGRLQSTPQQLTTKRPGFLDCPGYDGRLLLDVYHHVSENFPGLSGEGSYKLDSVSLRFLGQKKEDINYKQIPVLQRGDANSRRDLAVYCLKDVYLVLLLLKKLQCLEKQTKEAKQSGIPFNAMRTRRRLKNVAKKCLDAIEKQYILADN